MLKNKTKKCVQMIQKVIVYFFFVQNLQKRKERRRERERGTIGEHTF